MAQDFLLSSRLELAVQYRELSHGPAGVSTAKEEQVPFRIEETPMFYSNFATEHMLVVDPVEVGAEAFQVPNHSDPVSEWLSVGLAQ